MNCVYILYSEGHDKYYIGQTDNIELRLKFHNELSEKSFTSKYRPWVLKLKINTKTRGIAVRMERYIKKRKSKKYIKLLICSEKAVEKLKCLYSSAG